MKALQGKPRAEHSTALGFAEIPFLSLTAVVEDQVTALTGDGFDLLFEASGAPPALKQAFEVVRRGGTLVQIGVFSAPEIALPINPLLVRELRFVGSFRYGNVWEEGIRLDERDDAGDRGNANLVVRDNG